MGAVGGGGGSSSQAGLSGSIIGNNLTTSCNDTINPNLGALSAVSQQTIGAVSPGGSGALAGTLNDINAQDANEGNLRRERYVVEYLLIVYIPENNQFSIFLFHFF